jgi:DNA-binding CsgD family transcriptional regulator
MNWETPGNWIIFVCVTEKTHKMELNKDYDPNAHLEKVRMMISERLGSPVDPPWEEVKAKWDGMCRFSPPRTFMFVVDIKKDGMLLSNGMSLLGFPDNKEFSSSAFSELVHVNQRLMMLYQTLCVHEIFFTHPQLIKGKDVVYCTSRGIRDVNDKYWLCYQTATPLQYDENDIMVRYLSSYKILGEYHGEAFGTEIYTSPKFPREQKDLNRLVAEIKANMINALGFSRLQKQVVEYMAIKLSSSEIAKQLEISKRTLEKHRKNILDQARTSFPLNSFNSAADVVDYLVKQKII